MRRRVALSVLAPVLVALLVACGGGRRTPLVQQPPAPPEMGLVELRDKQAQLPGKPVRIKGRATVAILGDGLVVLLFKASDAGYVGVVGVVADNYGPIRPEQHGGHEFDIAVEGSVISDAVTKLDAFVGTLIDTIRGGGFFIIADKPVEGAHVASPPKADLTATPVADLRAKVIPRGSAIRIKGVATVATATKIGGALLSFANPANTKSPFAAFYVGPNQLGPIDPAAHKDHLFDVTAEGVVMGFVNGKTALIQLTQPIEGKHLGPKK
jgi:hypothetical protein